MSGVELKLTADRERSPSSLALADAAAAARHLLFEGVLDLFAGVFEVGLRLVALALIFSALVAGDLADRFFGLAAKVLGLVLRLIRTAHSVSSYFAGIGPGGRNLSPLGTSPAGFQNARASASASLVGLGILLGIAVVRLRGQCCHRRACWSA